MDRREPIGDCKQAYDRVVRAIEGIGADLDAHPAPGAWTAREILHAHAGHG
ncbi:MAG: hypothetical protein ACYDAG_12130 [Chloroflexota bacterium]